MYLWTREVNRAWLFVAVVSCQGKRVDRRRVGKVRRLTRRRWLFIYFVLIVFYIIILLFGHGRLRCGGFVTRGLDVDCLREAVHETNLIRA